MGIWHKIMAALIASMGFLSPGIGISSQLWSSNHIAYGLLTLRGEIGSRMPRGFRYGPGIHLGFLFQPLQSMKTQVVFDHFLGY